MLLPNEHHEVRPHRRWQGARKFRCCLAAAGLTAAPFVGAHAPDVAAPLPAIPWSSEPWVICCLLASLLLYVAGLWRLWEKAGVGRGLGVGRAGAFGAGWLALVLALVSPLDALGGLLFSAHMVQHEVLMILAAPLLVMGRPLAVWTWGLPRAWRSLAGQLTRRPAAAGTWHVLTHPPVAWALHGLALWAWHLPPFFEAALRSPLVHSLQHTSFLMTALLFWWPPLGGASRTGHGSALLYLFTTMLHTGALGALLTFSTTPWYSTYGTATPALGFDLLEDQRLGGLVMWVPAGLAYLVVALAAAARLLHGEPASVGLGRAAKPSGEC